MGGKHKKMTVWTTDDDNRLLQLQMELGKTKWKAIASSMPGRSVASVRNRFFRIDRGARLVQEGKGKNRCTRCGEMKRGHVCRYKTKTDDDTVRADMNSKTRVASMLTSMRMGASILSPPCFQESSTMFASLIDSNELKEEKE